MDPIKETNEKLKAAMLSLRQKEINSFVTMAKKEFNRILLSADKKETLVASWVRPSVAVLPSGELRLDIHAAEMAVESMVDRHFEQFRSKTLLKVKTILRFRSDAMLTVKSLEVSSDGPRGIIEVKYQNGDSFQLKSAMVWVHEASGKEPYCRFPSTFHNIKLGKKNYPKKPHSWMVLVFTGHIGDEEFQRKEERGELDSLFRRMVLGKSEEDSYIAKEKMIQKGKKLSFVEENPTAAQKVIISFEED